MGLLLVGGLLVMVPAQSALAAGDDADSPDAGRAPEATQVIEEFVATVGQPIEQRVSPTARKEPAVQNTSKRPPTGTETPVADPAKAPEGPGAKVVPWRYLLNEGFEGSWPNSQWTAFDNNGATGGFYCWDDDDFKPKVGFWSAWPANGCANAVDPQFFFYPNNADSWTTYGPFSLVGATQAQFNFRYWNESEKNFDWFYWCASGNGLNFGCKRVSGANTWKNVTMPLSNVPLWGDLRRDPTVWIGFIFTSDGSNIDDGPFVDNVVVRVR